MVTRLRMKTYDHMRDRDYMVLVKELILLAELELVRNKFSQCRWHIWHHP